MSAARKSRRDLEDVLFRPADQVGTEPRDHERRSHQGRYPSTA